MLGTTPSGDAYTFSEYERMFRNAGFKASELHPLPPTPERVVISRKWNSRLFSAGGNCHEQ